MTHTDNRPGALDRGALILTLVIGAAIVVVTATSAVMRVTEVLRNSDVPVAVALDGIRADLPIGPDGGSVVATVPEAVIAVSGMPPITVVSLVLAAVVPAAAIIAATVFGSFAVRNLLRGRAFTAANVGWVGGVVTALAVGFVLTWLFTQMGANGASAAATGGPVETVPLPLEPVVILGLAALGVIAAAFQSGHRLERETAGLV